MEKLRPLVHRHAHQHAAGAAAHAVAKARIAIALSQQRIADVEIIVEGVLLAQKLSVFIPLLAQFAAAANMGDSEHKTAVEQAQAAGAEIRIHACAIGAVAVHQQWAGAFTEMFMTVDQRDRDFDAVAGVDPQMLAAVVACIEPFDFLLFQHPPLAGIHIQLKQRIRRRHGGVAVAQAGGFRLRIIGKPGHIGRIVKGNALGLSCLTIDLTQAGQPALALFHNQPVGKQGKSFQHDFVTRRDQGLPLLLIAQGSAIKAEVLTLTVRAQIESVLIVIEAIFMIFTPR